MDQALKSCFLVLLLLPISGEAQSVSGRVRSAVDGAPVAGAVIQIVYPNGEPTFGLSGSQGLFRISARPGDAVQVEIEMIGHRPWISLPTRLGVADSVYFDVLLEAAPVELGAIVAESRNLCAGISNGTAGIDVLWRDARTALTAHQISGAQRRLRFLIETYERDIASDSLVVLRDFRNRVWSTSPEAFRAAPVSWLEERGFLQERDNAVFLYGPTPTVLLDDWFVRTHCLSIVPPEPGDTMIAIAFAPNRDRRTPDIRGVVHLDARSRDLRSIEFAYVSLPARVPSGSSGRAVFSRLPDGSVMIREWNIDSPIIELGEISVFGERRPVERVWATRRTGGEVLRAQHGTAEVYRAHRATIEGVVFDSVNRVPLAGARVFVVGSGFATRTDSSGAYRLEDLPEGNYRLSFEHPRLVAFGYRPAPREVVVARGDSALVDLAMPSSARLLVSSEDVARLDSIAAVGRYLGVNLDARSLQPEEARRAAFDPVYPVRIVMRVVQHDTGEPVSGVEVSLVRAETREVVASGFTDGSGQLEFERVPGGDYEVSAHRTGYLAPTENRVTLEPGLVFQMVVRLRLLTGRPSRYSDGGAKPFQQYDPAPRDSLIQARCGSHADAGNARRSGTGGAKDGALSAAEPVAGVGSLGSWDRLSRWPG